MASTKEIRNKLSNACESLQDSIHEFKVLCKTRDWKNSAVYITDEFTEIFPNIMAKVTFEKDNGSKVISIKAKAGSKIDPHKMLPERFVYVIHGDQRDETGVIVLNEDEGMIIKPLQEVTMHFKVDTKLMMEIEPINE